MISFWWKVSGRNGLQQRKLFYFNYYKFIRVSHPPSTTHPPPQTHVHRHMYTMQLFIDCELKFDMFLNPLKTVWFAKAHISPRTPTQIYSGLVLNELIEEKNN